MVEGESSILLCAYHLVQVELCMASSYCPRDTPVHSWFLRVLVGGSESKNTKSGKKMIFLFSFNFLQCDLSLLRTLVFEHDATQRVRLEWIHIFLSVVAEALKKQRLFQVFFMVIGSVIEFIEALGVGWNHVTTFMSWHSWGIRCKTPKDQNPWELKFLATMLW